MVAVNHSVHWYCISVNICRVVCRCRLHQWYSSLSWGNSWSHSENPEMSLPDSSSPCLSAHNSSQTSVAKLLQQSAELHKVPRKAAYEVNRNTTTHWKHNHGMLLYASHAMLLTASADKQLADEQTDIVTEILCIASRSHWDERSRSVSMFFKTKKTLLLLFLLSWSSYYYYYY